MTDQQTLRQQIEERLARQEWFGVACCPGNITRFMASVPGYFYAQDGDTVYVNLYAEGKAELKKQIGERVHLSAGVQVAHIVDQPTAAANRRLPSTHSQPRISTHRYNATCGCPATVSWANKPPTTQNHRLDPK